MVQCRRFVPHNSSAVISCETSGHISRALSFLSLWLAWKTSFLPPLRPSAPGVTHIKQWKGPPPRLCAYCLYTHHTSQRAHCHHCKVRTSTSCVGTALLYNVRGCIILQLQHQPAATTISPCGEAIRHAGMLSLTNTCPDEAFPHVKIRKLLTPWVLIIHHASARSRQCLHMPFAKNHLIGSENQPWCYSDEYAILHY